MGDDIATKIKELQEAQKDFQGQLQKVQTQMQTLEQQRQTIIQNLLKLQGGIAALQSLQEPEEEKR
jgi:F0F1-type ATP synthase membrane subunit b/b'